MEPGKRNLITDVDGLLVGQAADHEIVTGVTVLTAEEPFTAGVNVMGGAPGTRESDLLGPDKLVPAVDALVLSGGSAFGLAAAQGVMDALAADGRGFAVGPHRVPIVPAAILFDLINGGRKDWPKNPYPALGRDALAAAGTVFDLGTAGAGTGAIAGALKGGVGSASLVTEGCIIGALVAVNALGNTVADEQGRFWAAPFEIGAEFGGLGMPDRVSLSRTFETKREAMERANTTIAIVATDAPLDKAGCTRLATAAQDGLARSIVPAHTPFDGDLVFAVSTGRGPAADPVRLGHAAAVTLSRAVARAVFKARPMPDDIVPAWSARFGS
ncbi:MAG: P1 family peptidase [Rubricella sp.]